MRSQFFFAMFINYIQSSTQSSWNALVRTLAPVIAQDDEADEAGLLGVAVGSVKFLATGMDSFSQWTLNCRPTGLRS